MMSGRVPRAVELDICFAHETNVCSAVVVVSE
jgi:hypothetical protein